MEKIWLKHYPKGIPHEIAPLEYKNIADLFLKSVQHYSDLPCIENMGKILTYAECDRLTKQMASFYVNDLGLKKGDRIAMMMPNCLQYPIALYAAFRAGLIVVNVNPLYTVREFAHQMNDSGAKAIVVLANMAHTVEAGLPKCPELKHVIVTELGDLFDAPKKQIVNFLVKYVINRYPGYKLPEATKYLDALKAGDEKSFKDVETSLDDIAFLQYTGGTTGVAKGAMLTHRNMLSNLEQAESWVAANLERRQEIVITALPLYHIFSLTANCLVFMKMGAKNVLITNPRDIKGFIKELSKHKFTAITGVNTLFNALMNNPNFEKLDFSSMKLSMGGGMAVQHAVAERWKKITGRPLIEAYGLTETSPAAMINPFDSEEYTGAIGLPIPSTEVKVIGENGEELDISEVGELCIRGPQVMKGYWNMPEETAQVLDSDGWLKTGDMAKIDGKGFVYIVDRKKDMILVSGFNVYPNEIEDAVMEMPGILEAAAVGEANENSGQLVKLFVVKKDPSITEKQIIDFCRKGLTAYKVPKKVVFVKELPKTNVGKILRRELRDEPAG